MFEKEAEKWVSNNFKLYLREPSIVVAKRAFKDGAEFGYNKANEWHYVKDELPDEGTYLVVWQNDNGYKEIFIMNYEEDDEEELHWVDGDCEIQDEYIKAWKEIVFPELKESE